MRDVSKELVEVKLPLIPIFSIFAKTTDKVKALDLDLLKAFLLLFPLGQAGNIRSCMVTFVQMEFTKISIIRISKLSLALI